MNYNKEILNRIKQLRLKKNLSQFDMADRICASQPAYSRLESGVTTLDIERLLLITDALETDITTLLMLDTDTTSNSTSHPNETNTDNLSEETALIKELQRLQQQQQQQQQQQLIAQQIGAIQELLSQEILALKNSIMGLLQKD